MSTPDLQSNQIRLGAVRGMTYGLFDKPGLFMPALRALGGSMVRVYFYWSQIEPEPDRFVWDAVDAFLDQLEPEDEAWITVCSSSTWATQRKARLLPPSPALDIERYSGFIGELVRYCGGRLNYWQCDNEPSMRLLWAGTASEYLTQLAAFHRAVKNADPNALVVLGGAPPDAVEVEGNWSNPTAVEVFDRLLKEGGDHFDVFDLHLYMNPYLIPASIAECRRRMDLFGQHKPLIVGEYNGPLVFHFPEVIPTMIGVMKTLLDQVTGISLETQSAEDAFAKDEPAMVDLYNRMASLPAPLQMFMQGCSPDLEEKRHRINCREIVMRNMLALSCGVRRTLCWQFAPETTATESGPYHVMNLLFGKFMLMRYSGDMLVRHPAGETFALLSSFLADATEVRRVGVDAHPAIYLFKVSRGQRGPILVVWYRRDGFDGEDEPAVDFNWQWDVSTARAVDAFGAEVEARVIGGRLSLPICVTPLFIE